MSSVGDRRRLPDSRELANTTIVRANRKNEAALEQICYSGFRSSTPIETYHKQYLAYKNGEWAQPGRNCIWILVRRDDEEAQTDPLSWLETVRVSNTLTDPDRQATVADVYAVGPVMTVPATAGRGYATRLIQLLHYCLAHPAHLPPFPSSWVQPPLLFLNPDLRPRTLPYGLGAMITTGAGLKLYEGATIGEVPGTGFRFDRDTNNTFFTLPLSEHQNQSDGAKSDMHWRSTWVRKRDLDDLGMMVAESLRNRLNNDPPPRGGPILTADPTTPGALTRLSYFVFFFTQAPECNNDSIVGVRYYPASHERDGDPPAHQADWPICLFWTGLRANTTIVAHLSRFSAELVPSLINKWRVAAEGTGVTAVAGWAVDVEHSEVKELIKYGMKVSQRYDAGSPPFGHVLYGPADGSEMDGKDRMWRYCERWSWY